MKHRLFVADNIEPLASGKLLCVGLFPDQSLVLRTRNEAPPPSAEEPFAVNLTLMLCFTELDGARLAGSVSVQSPIESVQTFGVNFDMPVAPGAPARNVIVPLRPLLVPAGGVYTVLIHANGQNFTDSFTVRVEPPTGKGAPREAATAKKRARRRPSSKA